MQSIKLITFDLDDTLWDIEGLFVQAEKAVYQWLEIHCSDLTSTLSLEALTNARLSFWHQHPELRHQLSRMRQVSLATQLVKSGYSSDQAEKLSQEAFEVFMEHRHRVTFFDDVHEILTQLSRQYQLGALSNGNACPKRLGIGQYFDFHFSAEILNASKPSPDHFEAALAFADCQPQEMIHIGDNPLDDIQGAQTLGIHTIWFNPQESPWQSDTPPPTAHVIRLGELPDVISDIERSMTKNECPK